MSKVKLQFCVLCHKIRKMGKWTVIDDKTDKELRRKFGKWTAVMVVCPDCQEVDDDRENA